MLTYCSPALGDDACLLSGWKRCRGCTSRTSGRAEPNSRQRRICKVLTLVRGPSRRAAGFQIRVCRIERLVLFDAPARPLSARRPAADVGAPLPAPLAPSPTSATLLDRAGRWRAGKLSARDQSYQLVMADCHRMAGDLPPGGTIPTTPLYLSPVSTVWLFRLIGAKFSATTSKLFLDSSRYRDETVVSLFLHSLCFQLGCFRVAGLFKQFCLRHYSCPHRISVLNPQKRVVGVDAELRFFRH